MAVADVWQDCHRDGGMSRHAWRMDPKRLAFTLARYKHTAKLLSGQDSVLEVGCADGYGARIVKQHVGSLVAIDIDPSAIVEAKASSVEEWPIEFKVGNIMDAPLEGFSAAYALDVLEHVAGDDEIRFLLNFAATARVAVLGMPSLESQPYASSQSKAGHINCKSGEDLKATLGAYYRHVFVFSMSDETLHTGFYPMANYLLALCCEPRSRC